MKVIREEESFKPVTIVLESQDELDWLFCCLARTSTNDGNKTYADEVGGRLDRFSSSTVDVGLNMYEAVREIMEGK